MIECIFTLDYEIYGNGRGNLRDLVYEPATKLIELFNRADAQMVVFVEVAELEMIEAAKSDPAIKEVIEQVGAMYNQGHEIALHLHPQWYNANYRNGSWVLDNSEYNLCTLPGPRIVEITDRAIGYLQNIVGGKDYQPTSFRAGNWLFQPTGPAAKTLAERGIKIDSSVFKGGVQRQHRLDYRHAMKNGDFWKFSADVTTADPAGRILEIPIYTEMVPFWKMATSKRTAFRNTGGGSKVAIRAKINKMLDRARFFYPLKFDFCRMTLKELTAMVDRVIIKDRNASSYKPLVAIGHTKDLEDFETVASFLSYLKGKNIAITTLEKACNKCRQ